MLLLLGALIWGTAFVAQSVGSGYVGSYTFLAARSWLACAFFDRAGFAAPRQGPQSGSRCSVLDQRPDAAAGRCILRHCAVCGFGGTADRHWHHQHGQGGLLTALYVVLVPLLGVFFGRRPGGQTGNLRLHQPGGAFCLLCLAGHGPAANGCCCSARCCLRSRLCWWMQRRSFPLFLCLCLKRRPLPRSRGGGIDCLLRHFVQRRGLHPADSGPERT